jgi:hypothetical protein
MYFQTLDDKSECVGVYTDGKLHFDDIPSNLKYTWKYTGSIKEEDIKYAWIVAQGATLSEVCPKHLNLRLEKSTKKMNAFYKSFKLAKINLLDHCVFDLIPQDSLKEFCEIKNQITQHVLENYEIPANYDFLSGAHKMVYDIREQKVNADIQNCRGAMTRTNFRLGMKKIMQGSKHINYNIFGTSTGRLSTAPHSFPILTMKKDFRKCIKPHNDWFISFDYNGAEVRTVLALLGLPQPEEDVHQWNMKNIFDKKSISRAPTRDEAKVLFFGWLYNPDSEVIKGSLYDRDKIVDEHYFDGYVHTIFNRKIKVDERRALSYTIQSTTSDLVIERAMALKKMLKGRKSFISHIMHDEVVIDLSDEDRSLLLQAKEEFAQNRLGTYKVNVSAGQNYFDMEELKI